MTTFRKSRLYGTFAALAAAGVLMCTSGAAGASIARPSIRFVGDSITAYSAPMLTTYFTWAGYGSVHVAAIPGSDTYARQWDVYADAKAAPTVEVINLGTNDTNHITGLSPQAMSDVLHRLRAFGSHALFPHTCVVFVTVSTHMTSWNPTNAAIIDAQIRAFPHVVDWDAAYQPTYFDSADNVHPNVLGQHVLVHLIANAVAKC